MKSLNTDAGQVTLDGDPNKCPYCHKNIIPINIYGHKNNTTMEVYLICPNQECLKSFIGYYDYYDGYYKFNGQTNFGNVMNKEFSDSIESVSKNFITIYNQSFYAEQHDLLEICGVGYRKSLEFLIKEYLILNKPNEKDNIEKKLLGKCIADYIDDARIKSVSKRAVWLGNDETHFIRKWEGQDLKDLKRLIELTVHWIEMESLTKSFEFEMPDK